MLDVLLLLTVTGRLLQGLDDERGGGGDDRDGSLTILDRKSDGDTETFLETRKRFESVAVVVGMHGASNALNNASGGDSLPSHQWPSRCLHQFSLATDPKVRP